MRIKVHWINFFSVFLPGYTNPTNRPHVCSLTPDDAITVVNMTLWRRHYDNEPPHRSWPPAESAQPSSAAHTEPTPPRAIGIDGSPQVSLSHSMPRRLPLTMCWTTIATSVLLLLAGSVLADPQPLPTELRRPSVANDPQAPAPDDGPGGSASSSSAVAQWVQCPDAADNSACPCHQFESGKYI